MPKRDWTGSPASRVPLRVGAELLPCSSPLRCRPPSGAVRCDISLPVLSRSAASHLPPNAPNVRATDPHGAGAPAKRRPSRLQMPPARRSTRPFRRRPRCGQAAPHPTVGDHPAPRGEPLPHAAGTRAVPQGEASARPPDSAGPPRRHDPAASRASVGPRSRCRAAPAKPTRRPETWPSRGPPPQQVRGEATSSELADQTVTFPAASLESRPR